MSSTSARVLAECLSDSSEQAFAPSPSARLTSDAAQSSESTGRALPSIQTHVITLAFPCQDLSVAGKRAGLSGSQSSLMFNLLGLLPRTSITPGSAGCPNCDAACTPSGMPACRFTCLPLSLARGIPVDASSLLPTPTASSYGSCRGGGNGRVGKWRMSLQSRGIQHPEDWERLMGFPVGFTDVSNSATPSCPTSPSSSLEESEKS